MIGAALRYLHICIKLMPLSLSSPSTHLSRLRWPRLKRLKCVALISYNVFTFRLDKSNTFRLFVRGNNVKWVELNVFLNDYVITLEAKKHLST